MRKLNLVMVAAAFVLVAGCKGNTPEAPSAPKAEEVAKPAEAPAPAEAPKPETATQGKVMTTESGLKVEMLKEGDGPKAEAGQRVIVHYTGTLTDGKVFDSSVKRGQPFKFILGRGQVIKGWDEGIGLLKIGSKAKLTIPPELGYGERGAGGVIPGGATLIFEVELLGVE